MPKMSAQDATNKWVNRTKASRSDYEAGIGRVSRAPGAAAAEQGEAWLAGVQASFEKWKNNTAAVSLEEWKEKAISKGAGRISAGVDASYQKTLAATERNFGNIEQAQGRVKSMPKVTFDDRMQRMVTYATVMHDLAQRGRG